MRFIYKPNAFLMILGSCQGAPGAPNEEPAVYSSTTRIFQAMSLLRPRAQIKGGGIKGGLFLIVVME